MPLLIDYYKNCCLKICLFVHFCSKLRSGTIQIRRSMIKVEADSTLPTEKCFNSLEVVAVRYLSLDILHMIQMFYLLSLLMSIIK